MTTDALVLDLEYVQTGTASANKRLWKECAVTSPVRQMGMETGFRDSVGLSWRMWESLRFCGFGAHPLRTP